MSVQLFTPVICITTEQIWIKFGLGDLYQTEPDEFNFHSYQSNIIPTLHEFKFNFDTLKNRSVNKK